MKCLAAIALLLFTALSAFAVDPPPLHWYQITLLAGTNTMDFTGSSSLDASQLATRISGSDPIKLDNLREVFASTGNAQQDWHPARGPSSVFILPRTVFFYSELPSDPAAGKQ